MSIKRMIWTVISVNISNCDNRKRPCDIDSLKKSFKIIEFLSNRNLIK